MLGGGGAMKKTLKYFFFFSFCRGKEGGGLQKKIPDPTYPPSYLPPQTAALHTPPPQPYVHSSILPKQPRFSYIFGGGVGWYCWHYPIYACCAFFPTPPSTPKQHTCGKKQFPSYADSYTRTRNYIASPNEFSQGYHNIVYNIALITWGISHKWNVSHHGESDLVAIRRGYIYIFF